MVMKSMENDRLNLPHLLKKYDNEEYNKTFLKQKEKNFLMRG